MKTLSKTNVFKKGTPEHKAQLAATRKEVMKNIEKEFKKSNFKRLKSIREVSSRLMQMCKDVDVIVKACEGPKYQIDEPLYTELAGIRNDLDSMGV